MSLIGPRPLWVEEATQCHGWTQKRLDNTPGIIGLWQVLGRRECGAVSCAQGVGRAP